MLEKINIFYKKKLNRTVELLEDIWVKFATVICFIFASIFTLLHYFGMIQNIRSVVDSVINFSSIVIGVTGVFLTLIVTLKESPVFERLKQHFPIINKLLYTSLRNQIFYGLIVVILSIFIISLPSSPYRYLSSIGIGIWFYFFFRLTLGSFYTVKLITDLVVKNFEDIDRKTRI